MIGLDLSHLSLQLAEALIAFSVVTVALVLFLLVLYKLKCDLERKEINGKLRVGTKGVLEEIQDSMSETERDKRLGAPMDRNKDVSKKKGPSADVKAAGARDKGKNALGEKHDKEKKKSKKEPLYPTKKLEALEIGNSESEELSPSEGSEEEAARYEEERYHLDPPG